MVILRAMALLISLTEEGMFTVFDIIFLCFFGYKVFFSLGGDCLQLGDFRPDGLPFGRSEDTVL